MNRIQCSLSNKEVWLFEDVGCFTDVSISFYWFFWVLYVTGLRLHNFSNIPLIFVPPQWQLGMFHHLIIIIQTYRAVPSLLWLDNNFKNSLRSKLSRASFLQETKFVEGKKRGRRGREGLTRAITLLETLVMQARYNVKCFFSLILSFGHGGKFSLNFPGLN